MELAELAGVLHARFGGWQQRSCGQGCRSGGWILRRRHRARWVDQVASLAWFFVLAGLVGVGWQPPPPAHCSLATPSLPMWATGCVAVVLLDFVSGKVSVLGGGGPPRVLLALSSGEDGGGLLGRAGILLGRGM